MNKKITLPILVIFSISLVFAGLVVNYFSSTVNIDVTNKLSVEGDLTYSLVGDSGDSIFGNLFSISNDGENAKYIQLVTLAEEGIDTSYFGETQLTKKTVDFNVDVWEIPEEAEKVNLKYVAVGDEFNAQVENPLEGYSLIYYKDNSDRFNSPANAVLVSEISSNLPYEDDKNALDYDYCLTGEYLTCHGAKIWYIPTNAINEDGSLDWSRASEFYFETELIQFNIQGELTIYPLQSLELTPEFTLGNLETGQYSIITQVNPSI